MTYALAWPLQMAVHAALTADPAVTAIVGTRIYDAPLPPEAEADPDGLWVTIGDEEVRDWSTATDRGAVHRVIVRVHAQRRGFAEAKQAAGAICEALLAADLAPSRGRVVQVSFAGARTRRSENDALRTIEMRFRVSIEDTA